MKLRTVLAAAIAAGVALAVRALKQSREAVSPGGAGESTPTTNAVATAPAEQAEPTRAELYEEAKRRDIPGRSTMTKAQLQAALAQGG